MSEKVNWGILSTARIGVEKVIPAMQRGQFNNVRAIASRYPGKAREEAKRLGIEKAYGSYEELLRDDEVEAVYIPLPNHMHFEWMRKVMDAGKHVLCEKPLVLSVKEAEDLIQLRKKSNVKAAEAFMVAHHPQWASAKKIITDGGIGTLRAIQGAFSFYTDDPSNIRNIKEYGGGSLYDLGCYPLMTSRLVLGSEPTEVFAAFEIDQQFKTDRIATVVARFPECTLTFFASTQLAGYQRMTFVGTDKTLDVPQPFNPPANQQTSIYLKDGPLGYERSVAFEFLPCDHYTLQADAFSRAILEDVPVTVPLENALAMARIYEAIFRSAKEGRWAKVE